MGIKIVPRHGSTLKEKLYLPAIFGVLKTTLSHLFTNHWGFSKKLKPSITQKSCRMTLMNVTEESIV